MDLVKECRVMVERLSWEDLQFHKLSLQNSEMSLVNLQRVAIKEEMKDEENCNYDHLSKDDLIHVVKARDDRVRTLEAECNVLISNLQKERVKTTLTINKQIDDIERLNRVIKDLEMRIKDLMEKSGLHQFPNDELVKTEPVENDLGNNVRVLSLPIARHNVQGILCKENISQESRVSGVGNTNTKNKITLEKSENMGLITRNTNPCLPKLNYSDSLPLCAPSPNLQIENKIEMPPDTTTESDSPREPLENSIDINDSYRKSQSVLTELEIEDNTNRSQKFRVPELNVETEKHSHLSLDANVESDSLELDVENDLDDSQCRIALTDAKKTDNRQHQAMELFVDPSSLSVPVYVPKQELCPNELSELTSVSMESDLPEVPIEVENNSLVSNSETFEDVAPNIPEGKTSSPRSGIARFKYSTEYKKGLKRRIKKIKERKRFKCDQCDYSCKYKFDLIKHQRIHSGDKPFKCDQCEYASTNKSGLTIHHRVHSGEKSYKCDRCEYASNHKDLLIAHYHIHSGEKPFKCDRCEYAFTQKSSVTNHQCIHSGVKLHKCDQCKYASTKKSNLIIHHTSTHSQW